jgi:hypothetical protein
MQIDEILENFKSKDRSRILDAVWWVLGSADRELLSQLIPYIPELRKEIKKLDLGGMIYSNNKNFEMAMTYLQDFCSGKCRCNLYGVTHQFSPKMEANKNHVTILSSTLMKELYEEHFDVECSLCKKHFKVREVHGWHVPWYEWKIVDEAVDKKI